MTLQLIRLLILFLLSLATNSMAQTYRNIVIGEGCASICIDGECQNSCQSDSSTIEVNSPVTVQQKFNFDGFTSLDVSNIDTHIIASKVSSVLAISNQACLEHLNIELIKDGGKSSTLKAEVGGECVQNDPIKLVVTMPNLQSLDADGSSGVIVEGFSQEKISVSAYGNTTITIQSSRLRKMFLKTDDNADLSMLDSVLVESEVVIKGQSDVRLSFGKEEKGLLTGIVTGMSDLLYCGAPVESLDVLMMADVSHEDCEV